MIQVKKITLTPAILLTFPGTPYELLPAPPAGSVYNILGVTEELDFNTTAYTGATQLWYNYNPTVTVFSFYDNYIFLQSAAITQAVGKYSNDQLVLTLAEAFTITSDGTPGDGDSDLIVYVIYEIVVLD